MSAQDQTPDCVLLPYQRAWCEDDSVIRVAEKSRRLGWSWTMAAESALLAMTSEADGGCDTWYIGYNKDMAIEFIRDASFWALSLADVVVDMDESVFEDDDPDKNILIFTVHFASGFRISALSSRPTNLRGKRGRIIIDEAAFHNDLGGLIKAALAVKMWGAKRGGRIDIVSSHNGVESEFNKLITEIRANKKPNYSLHTCNIDEALAQGLYRRICLVNGEKHTVRGEKKWFSDLLLDYGEFADEELRCVPARSGGVYLARDLIERQMRPGVVVYLNLKDGFLNQTKEDQIRYVEAWCHRELVPQLLLLPDGLMHAFGEDFGRTSDRTVFVVGTIMDDLAVQSKIAVELSNVPYACQEHIMLFMLKRLPRFVRAAFDAGGNGGPLAETARIAYGAKVVETVMITSQWYAKHLPLFRAALQDSKMTLIANADHLVDLGMFKTVSGKPKLPDVRRPGSNKRLPPRHGDAAVAYLMLHHASTLPIQSYGYTAATAFERKLDSSRMSMRPVREIDNPIKPRKRGLL